MNTQQSIVEEMFSILFQFIVAINERHFIDVLRYVNVFQSIIEVSLKSEMEKKN